MLSSFLITSLFTLATGMSVDELQKSLIVQDKLGTLTADQAAAMNNLGLSAAEMENMSFCFCHNLSCICKYYISHHSAA